MQDTFSLSPERQKQLQAMTTQLNAIRATLDKMERAGLDVTEQKERLAQATAIREGFLREFGNPLAPR